MYRHFSFLTKHTAHLTTILFVLGFVFDSFLLPDLDTPFARYIGAAYLAAIGLLIMFREWVVSRNTASLWEQRFYSISTFGISYFSGSALSFVLIFALRSAQLSVSWPFFAMLLVCIAANELTSTHNFRFTLDVGIFLAALMFYVIFNMPLLTRVENDMTFMIAILTTVVLSFAYVYVLKYSSENAYYQAPRGYALSLGIPLFVAMLYFLNAMPAVPLSLKDAGVYHSIYRNSDGDYVAQRETDTRRFARFRTPVYHMMPADTGVYFFTAVKAPAALTAPISYTWEKYDPEAREWMEVGGRITFTLAGGREEGYRAYAYKEHVEAGLWRVVVRVGEKRIVGRVKFEVVEGETVEVREVKL